MSDLFNHASKGIVTVFESPIAFIVFMFFLTWASYYDLKTMTIKNYQNLSFFLSGLVLLILSLLGVPYIAFELGWSHLFGAIVGFLLLFIPGMIMNYAFGGDIKFVTAMGFWVGPTAILLILLVATFIQILILVARAIITKNFVNLKNPFPFAPAFSLAYILCLTFYLITM